MKVHYSFILTCLILLLFQNKLAAQTSQKFDEINSDISTFIPPLHVLIDSAMLHDPGLRMRELQIIINNAKLKGSRIDWTKNVGIQTDVRFGTFDNYSNNVSGGIPTNNVTTRTEMRYGYGAYISLPLFNAFNRGHQLTIAKTELEQARSLADNERGVLTQEVIRQYNDLVLRQRLLKIKSKSLETSRINMQMTEKGFLSGTISMSEYVTISEAVSRAEADCESARMDFLTSYLILEEIVGMKFNLTNPTQGK